MLRVNPVYQAKLKEHLKILNASKEHQEQLKRLHASLKGRARPEGAGIPSVGIEVFDIDNNETTVYVSIREAARAIEVNQSSISRAFKRLRSQSEGGESTI